MYLLKAERSFDAAHFLKGYKGKCSNLHGHRWRVIIEVQGNHLIRDGQLRDMIVDFKTLKRDLKDVVDYYDHSLIYEENSLKPATIEALKSENFRLVPVTGRPTAENLASIFCSAMEQKGYDIFSSTVYETPDNCAIFRPDQIEQEA